MAEKAFVKEAKVWKETELMAVQLQFLQIYSKKLSEVETLENICFADLHDPYIQSVVAIHPFCADLWPFISGNF